MTDEEKNFRSNMQRAINAWRADIARLQCLIPAVGWTQAELYRTDLEGFKKMIETAEKYLNDPATRC